MRFIFHPRYLDGSSRSRTVYFIERMFLKSVMRVSDGAAISMSSVVTPATMIPAGGFFVNMHRLTSHAVYPCEYLWPDSVIKYVCAAVFDP